MGTRGYRIIKFRGRYWIFYNHWDSYPEGMGNSLVEGIPEDPEEYQKWLESQRALFAKWDSLLHKLLCITPENLATLESDETRVGVWHEAFDERIENGTPVYHSGYTDMNIEFTYTIDLDLEVFSIDHAAHYRLNHIPRNGQWIKAMSEDGDGYRFVLPQDVPKESIASLTVEVEDFPANVSDYWKDLKTREVKPKRFYSTSSKLRWLLFRIFQHSQLSHLSVTLLGWTAQDLAFREIAFFILCLAAGGDHLALVDERRVIEPPKSDDQSEHLHAAIVEGSDPEGGRELISSVGSGYQYVFSKPRVRMTDHEADLRAITHLSSLPHSPDSSHDHERDLSNGKANLLTTHSMQGSSIGSASEDSKYWFEGALVCLVPRLNRPGVLEKAVADAIQYGRLHCARTSFHALLMSIENVVLIKSFEDGTVDHTKLLPLFSFDCHLSMNAWERYDDVDELYNDEVAKSEEVKAESSDLPSDETENCQKKVSGQDDGHIQETEEGTSERATKEDDEEPHDQAKKENINSKGQGEEDMVRADGHEKGQMVTNQDELVCEKEGAEVGKDTGNCERDRDDGQVEEDNPNLAGQAEDDKDGHTSRSAWTVEDTFNSLVQFFEATVHETLKPAMSDGELPIEIYGMILGNVTDTKTHNACMQVSRKFRSLCHQRPLIMGNLVFLEPLPSKPTSNKKLEEPTKAQEDLQFRVVECSSKRQMDVGMCSRYYSKVSFTCRMVIGSAKNRKSFLADCPIAFWGLDVSAPWDDVEQPSPRRNRGWSRRSEIEPTGTVWDMALQYEHVTTQSCTRQLARFWIEAVKSVFKGIEGAECRDTMSEAWRLPANTSQLCASSSSYTYEEFFHYLFVRIKRASKYWDNLWEDIIREATDNLAAPDKSFELEKLKRSGKQVLGADEPYVMLVVGLEVRLFKWEQGFPDSVQGELRKGKSPSSKLKELQTGKVYLVTSAEDREVLEKFLKTAAEKLQTAKKKEKPGYATSDDEK